MVYLSKNNYLSINFPFICMSKRISNETLDSSVQSPRQKVEKTPQTTQKSHFIIEDLPKKYLGQNVAIILGKNNESNLFKEGDYIKIIGERSTYARVISNPKEYQSYYKSRQKIGTESNKPHLQIDFNTRKNAEVKVGDTVRIQKIQCPPAKKIVIVPENYNSNNNYSTPDFKVLKKFLIGRVLSKSDDIWIPSFLNKIDEPNPSIKNPVDIYYTVLFCNPKGKKIPAVIVDKNTVIKLRNIPITDYDNIFDKDIYLDDVGGMKKVKETLLEHVSVIANEFKFIEKTGIKFSNSILLSGPSGCGKSLLAKAIVNEFPVSFFYINGPEIAGEKPTMAPEELKKIFDLAEEAGPSIILIDEVEALATKREDLRFDIIMRNVVTQFLHLLENISGNHKVFVIGTTNKPKTIDSAFLTSNRFGKVIKISPPKTKDRKEIIEIMARNIDIIDISELNTDLLAENTFGFSGGDLNILFQNAFIEKLKKLNIYNRFLKSQFSYRILKHKIKLNTNDILHILRNKIVKPSILRAYQVESPNISFDQVGGLNEVKKILEQNIKNPIIYPDIFNHYNVGSFKGLLLHGPPGCGKTLIIKALASEADINFISIKGAEVLNHWLGESEAAIRDIFNKAKDSAPCIIFFDELDAISTIRGVEGNVHSDRVTAQILTELDGIEDRKDVICIGATNRFDIIDPAITRPGRLYPIIKIELPSKEDRLEILQIYTKNKPISNEIDLKALVKKTEGFNGAVLEELCNQAALIAIQKYLDVQKTNPSIKMSPITMSDFNLALIDLKKKLKMEKKADLYS